MMIHKKTTAVLLAAGLVLQGSVYAFAQTAVPGETVSMTAAVAVNAGGVSVPGGPGTEPVSAAESGASTTTAGTLSAPVAGPGVGSATSSGSSTITAGASGGTSVTGPGVSGGSGTSSSGAGTADSQATAWTKVNGVYMDKEGNSIDGAVLRGVSVSKWQEDIDWSKVAADDVSFAFICMGSFGYEGEYTMDEYYEKNMSGAFAAGITAAPYVFLQTKTVDEAREAARYTVEKMKSYAVTWPVAVDIESPYLLELSVQELTDVVNAFCQKIAAAGYTPIVYSDYNKFSTEMDTNQIPYDLWVARYGGDGQYPNRTIWQSTDEGTVAGISGNVCLEFAYKNYTSSVTSASPVISAGN